MFGLIDKGKTTRIDCYAIAKRSYVADSACIHAHHNNREEEREREKETRLNWNATLILFIRVFGSQESVVVAGSPCMHSARVVHNEYNNEQTLHQAGQLAGIRKNYTQMTLRLSMGQIKPTIS